jgi:hypothetical protein
MKIKASFKFSIKAHLWLDLFKKVPNLEILDLCINNLTITGCMNCEILTTLKSLTINLTSCDMNAFFNYIRPHSLRKLEVKSYWIEFDNFINRQLQVNDLTILESNFNQSFERLHLEYFKVNVADATAVPNDKLINLICAHPEIKYLSNVKCTLSHYNIWNLKSRYSFSKMKTIDCTIRGDVFKALCNLPSLEKLIIFPTSQFDVSDLVKCTAKEVVIKNMRSLTNVSIEDLMDLKNLEKLTIDFFFFNSNTVKKFHKVRYLKLEQPNYDDCSFSQILNIFPNLKHLELGSSSNYSKLSFSDANIQYPHLKTLIIDSCRSFNGKPVKFLDEFPNLETLDLSSSFKIPFHLICLKKLSTMKKLKTFKTRFHIIKTTNLGSPVLDALEELCDKLENFDIRFMTSEKGIVHIATLQSKFPNIDVEGCYCILKSENFPQRF